MPKLTKGKTSPYSISLLLILVIGLFSCKTEEKSIIGYWQNPEKPEAVLEITETGRYIVTMNKGPVKGMELNYQYFPNKPEEYGINFSLKSIDGLAPSSSNSYILDQPNNDKLVINQIDADGDVFSFTEFTRLQ